MNIEKIDRNFEIKTNFNKTDVALHDVRNAPFVICGVYYENGFFRRMPDAVAKSVSERVAGLQLHTAGGRVRFRTDSPYVIIYAKTPGISRMPHFSLSGTLGMDLYERVNGEEIYRCTFVPPYDAEDHFEGLYDCGGNTVREYTINLPLYSLLTELYIGLQEGAQLLPPTPYTNDLPVVFYGSSITQGACASRPGRTYESVISRRFHLDYINLGFSGAAKGEDAMIDYLASLPMSVFVYDYDYNSDSAAQLEATHEKLYRAVRATHPTIPIILMTRPKIYLTDEEKKRRVVIETTYRRAKEAGENVYLLTGEDLLSLAGNEGTVEGVHPNDFGFASMAQAVGDLLKEVM